MLDPSGRATLKLPIPGDPQIPGSCFTRRSSLSIRLRSLACQ
jgi:hypothetical protein